MPAENKRMSAEKILRIKKMKNILKRREKELARVNDKEKDEILAKGLELTPGIKIRDSLKSHQKIIHIMYHHYMVSNEETAKTDTRRNALDIIRRLSRIVNAAIDRKVAAEISASAVAAKKDSKRSVPDKNCNQSSKESGKENVGVASRHQRENQKDNHAAKGNAAVAVSSRSSHAAKPPARPPVQRNPELIQQQKPSHAQRGSSITQNGKFSLSNYCQANDAYEGGPKTAGINNNKETTNKAAASINRSPPPFHKPPPYQQRSSNFGVSGTPKSRSKSAPQNSSRKSPVDGAAGREDATRKRLEAQHKRDDNARREAKENEEQRKKEKEKRLQEEAEQRKRDEAKKLEAKRLAEKREKEAQAQRLAEQRKKEEQAKRQRLKDQRKREEEKQKRLEREAEQKHVEQQKRLEEQRERKRLEAHKLAEEQRKRDEDKKRADAMRKRAADNKAAEIFAVMQAADVATHERRVVIPADNVKPLKSAGLHERPAMTVRYKPQRLNRAQAEDLTSRLARWDPYWSVSKFVKCGVTSAAKDCATNTKKMLANFSFSMTTADIRELKNSDWGTSVCGDCVDGQTRLMLRMLPVKPNGAYPRADCHLWPKGTYLNLNGGALCLEQRKQQQHDHGKWQGLSKPLDLTAHIRQPTNTHEIKMLTFEDQPYFFCVALCKYMAPATLQRRFINSSEFEKLSRQQGIIKAKSFTDQAAVNVDDDDDGPVPPQDDSGKVVFTLTCPYSRTIMKKPVRGKQCKHYQCFDLNSFLESNKILYGQRWRCLICEHFRSFDDLQLDGLQEDLIFEFRKEVLPTERDRIEFCANGSYNLLPARKQRHNKNKKRSVPDASSSAPVAKKAAPAENEIICLD